MLMPVGGLFELLNDANDIRLYLNNTSFVEFININWSVTNNLSPFLLDFL